MWEEDDVHRKEDNRIDGEKGQNTRDGVACVKHKFLLF